MRIISEHNKKDFYDYSGFGYDTSNDIVFLRFPKEEIVEDNRYRYFYYDRRLPSDDWFENYVIIYNIVGIYPYCYIIPIITDNYEDITTKQQIVIPYELTLKKVEDINDFLKNTGQKIRLQQPKYFSFINGIEESFWKDEDIFKQLETPVFLCYPGFNPTQKYTDHLKIIKNVIFNEQPTNWLKYIKDDLDKRDVYTDIENYLWSMKQEPTSEPDNKTKIVSHGFDLKTSFRKM